MESINPKCSRCKCYFEPKLKTSGLSYKSCEKCRNKMPKCIHKKRKYQCRDCSGSAFCIHNKFKTTCRDCNGSSFCIHNKFKTLCRECNCSSFCIHDRLKKKCRECGDEIEKTIIRFMSDSRKSDKYHNKFDIVNFIDKDFCRLLIEESEYKCCYCKCDLDLIFFGLNLISIERIDNKIGHTKSNVKIACLSCNSSKAGNKNST